jgi:hypothetical protein
MEGTMAKQVKAPVNGMVLGRNVNGEMHGNVLTLRIDLSQPGQESKSGKSEVIGSTNGNVGIPGTDVKVGLNVYRSV